MDLDAATLSLRASATKNRQEATLPLPEGTVAALKALRGENQLPAVPVFPVVPTTAVLREDLTAAEIEAETDAGVVDLHALRVTFATLLARAGVPLVQAQQLLRHSDPKLTANVYTRLELVDGRKAVEMVSIPSAAAVESEKPAGA